MTGNPQTRDSLAEQRHAETIEALHVQGDRTNRHLAEVSAKVESALRFFVGAWKAVRELEHRPAKGRRP